MSRLARRLSALEVLFDPPWKPWHRILVDVGEDQDEAIVRYEAEHGPICGAGVIIVQFI